MRFSIFLAAIVSVLSGCSGAPRCGDALPTIDGYTYKTVKIGDQEWFAENLKTTVYANGDEIPYSRADESWTAQEMGMRCSYDHDEARSALYGQLYNWYAVDDNRGLCPCGWHVPSDEDWQDLEVFIGMSRHPDLSSWDSWLHSDDFGVGSKLKARLGWAEKGNGTDDFGFSALPGGWRADFSGSFVGSETSGTWWSSSPSLGKRKGVYRELSCYTPHIYREGNDQRLGLSVRCLRDSE